MKLCSKCLICKDESEFVVCASKADGLGYWCRVCKRAHDKVLRDKRKNLIRSLIRLIKKKIGKCMDCGRNYPPYVMDFDHRDRETKVASLHELVSYPGITNIKKLISVVLSEIDKCDLVCSNCHRERTHLQEELDKRAHSLMGEHLTCNQEIGVRFAVGPEFKKEVAKNLNNIV